MAAQIAATIAGTPIVSDVTIAILSDVESVAFLLEGDGVGGNEIDSEENKRDDDWIRGGVGVLEIADTC